MPRRSTRLAQVPLSSAQLRKNRDKLVALLEEGQLQWEAEEAAQQGPGGLLLERGELSLGGMERDGSGSTMLPPALAAAVSAAAAGQEGPAGRITIYCTAAGYDLPALRDDLRARQYRCGGGGYGDGDGGGCCYSKCA